MCNLLHQGEGDDYLLAYTFLATKYNLMSRSDNFLNIHTHYVQWHYN